MDEDAGSGSAMPDEWGLAVTRDDSTKLAELVLVWTGSKPERALSILRECVSVVSLLEKEVAFSSPASPSVPSPPTTPVVNRRDSQSIMEGDVGPGSAGPDGWGSAVARGDATKLAELVLVRSGSKPERALSVLRDCVCLLEKEVAFSAPAAPAVPSPPTTPEPTRSSCLDALVVALNETCDGKSWYTSTKELQLASLEFCIACRNYPTVHMNVDVRIPRQLLAAADAPPPHPKRLCQTRVPRLQARRVTWNMPTAAELRNPIFAMKYMDYLKLGDAFEDSLEAVAWPRRLETLEFSRCSPFNKPVDLVQWPVSLQTLTFGRRFNRPIEQVSWPASLGRVEFGENFDQPIEEVEWPPSLRHLEFGVRFSQPIQRVRFPASLQQLIFTGAFNHPIGDVAWPSALRQLVLGLKFNQPIQRVRFPASLQQLIFGGAFNHPIEDVAWPSALRLLKLGPRFNQPIQGVRFPASLQRLIFIGTFNHPIEDVAWPSALRQLELGPWFNQPIQRVRFPASLQLLIFTGAFNHPIEDVAWPSALRQLVFSPTFNQPIQRATFPASLHQLIFGGGFNQPIADVSWPAYLQRLEFGTGFNQPIDNVRWPVSLQEVAFGWCSELQRNDILMYAKFNQRIGRSVWPATLRRLTVGGEFRQSLQGLGTWMPKLEALRVLDWEYDPQFHTFINPQNGSLLRGIEWPKGLRELTVLEQSSLDGVAVPSTVKVYRPRHIH